MVIKDMVFTLPCVKTDIEHSEVWFPVTIHSTPWCGCVQKGLDECALFLRTFASELLGK